ncbi:MAG: hypothetical protein NTX45_11860 [Proteobacteria bacterium]|nr:hypothetical protein [Pseudomonadota bacterium]
MNAKTHWPRFLTGHIIMIVPTLQRGNANHGAPAPEGQRTPQTLGFPRRSVGTIKPYEEINPSFRHGTPESSHREVKHGCYSEFAVTRRLPSMDAGFRHPCRNDGVLGRGYDDECRRAGTNGNMIVPTLQGGNVNHGAPAPEGQQTPQTFGFPRRSVGTINECRSVGTIKPSSHQFPRGTYSMAILNLILLLLLPCLAGQAQADCTSGYASDHYCLSQPRFDSLGGDINTGAYQITASNMYPIQALTTKELLDHARSIADSSLANGKSLRNGLLLVGIDLTKDYSQDPVKTKLVDMLKYSSHNYESVGLIPVFPSDYPIHKPDNLPNEDALIRAAQTYAHQLSIGYPVKDKLLDVVKTLTSLYLMIADEYLIDALELPAFSDNTTDIDLVLNAQINLLTKAQFYYEKGVNFFLICAYPINYSTPVSIADSFDSSIYELINLSVERLSLSLREKSSKQLVRDIMPDMPGIWKSKWAQAPESLKGANTSVYLATAAIANTRKSEFDVAGSSSGLVDALNAMRQQGNLYNQGFNPLGYDNRYIPGNNYSVLKKIADDSLIDPGAGALKYESDLKNAGREFDNQLDKLKTELKDLKYRYIDSLVNLTPCSSPKSVEDVIDQAFLDCTGQAGGNLLVECDLEASDFESCLSGVTGGASARGTLVTKYRDWRSARQSLRLARTKRINIDAEITNYTNTHNINTGLIQVRLNNQLTTLANYQNSMRNAQSIVETENEEEIRVKAEDKRKWTTSKQRTKSTQKTYTLRNDAFDYEITKEQDMLKHVTNMEILSGDEEFKLIIKNKELSRLEADIGIDLAITQDNAARDDFFNLLRTKENLWLQYQTDLSNLQKANSVNLSDPNTDMSLLPLLRIVRSQAVINLAAAMNNAANYAYLAAKALEYKYAKTLEEMSIEKKYTKTISVNDIFKAQKPYNLSQFLLNMDKINTDQCSYSRLFTNWIFSISYMQNLAITPLLDPEIADNEDAHKFFYTKSRIAENSSTQGNLRIEFEVPESASYIPYYSTYNMKLWAGSPPDGCGISIGNSYGIAVTLRTNSAVSQGPIVHLRQRGFSILKDKNGNFRDYIIENPQNSPIDGYIQAAQNEVPKTDVYNLPNYWTPLFMGRGLSSSKWELEIYNQPGIDFSQVYDIEIHFSTIRQSN